MPVRSIAAGETLGLARGEVAIWARDGSDLAYTDPGVLVVDGIDVVGAADPADVVVVSSGAVVGPGWLAALRAAAYCDTNVATASALGGVSLGLHPRVDDFLPGCVYVRRSALELAGPFDAGFGVRCTELGLVHVLADDVAVSGVAGEPAVGDCEPLARSVAALGRRARGGLSLVIDARGPDAQATGTQRHVGELVGALGRLGVEAIRVVGGEGAGAVSESDVMRAPGDIVHRPLQVFGDWQLRTLPRMAARTVITQHDLIAYRNPGYLPSRPEWLAFRRLTRLALAQADHVVFPSEHARGDALAEALVEAGRASVVRNGVDHGPAAAVAPVAPAGVPAAAAPVAPAGLSAAPPFVLCLGADYRHKNRVFALRVMAHRAERLVFAGPSVEHGSSGPGEAELLASDPSLAGRVVDVGPVSEGERAWLMANAALVLYPTVYEGFGFIPFEAAAAGVPSMWAATTSLAELLGDDAPIVMWDAAATAARAGELLGDREAARRNVERVRAAAARLTWDGAARELLALYERVCDGPPSPGATVAALSAEAAISEDGLRLVGPAGALPAELERPLLALATHRVLGAPVLGAIRAGYRLARRVRPRRG